MMKVSEFVEGYGKSTSKDSYVKRHIKRKYLPYVEKIVNAQQIVNNSMYNDGKFEPNTPKRHMLYIIKVVQLYTDLDINMDNLLGDFDAIVENGVADAIMKHIAEDLVVFESVLNMVVDDVFDKERNYQGYIEKKLDEFILVMQAAMNNSNKGEV